MVHQGRYYHMMIFDKRLNDSYYFLLLKKEAVNKEHVTKNFDVTRFCCQNCLLRLRCLTGF